MASHFQSLQTRLIAALRVQVNHWALTAPELYDEDENSFLTPFKLNPKSSQGSLDKAFAEYKKNILEKVEEIAKGVHVSILASKNKPTAQYGSEDFLERQKKLIQAFDREFPEFKGTLSGSNTSTQLRIEFTTSRLKSSNTNFFSNLSILQRKTLEGSGVPMREFNSQLHDYIQENLAGVLKTAAGYLEEQGNKDAYSQNTINQNETAQAAAEEKAFLDKMLRMQPDPAKWIITKGLFKGKSLQYVHDVVTGNHKDDGMMHKAAQWVLNTHAAMNIDPAQFSANFVVRGISEKVQREGHFDKAFAVMFRAADKKLGMVDAASTQLDIPDVGESDRERTRIGKSFYKDKRGRNRSSDRVTYIPPSNKEGEGFAVSDVENNREYNRRVSNQEADLAARKKRAARKISAEDTGRTSRSLPTFMDPKARAEYLHIQKMLDQMPARPVKEIYRDPATGEMTKGYRVRFDDPVMITYDKNGFPRVYQPDIHRLTRKNLQGRLRAIQEEFRESIGLDTYEQIKMVHEVSGRSSLDQEIRGNKKKSSTQAGSRVTDKPEFKTEDDERNQSMGRLSIPLQVLYAKRIQGAASHNELDRLQSEMYEELASKSNINLFMDPKKSAKERRLIASQIIDLAQIADTMGGDDARFSLSNKDGGRFEKKDFNQLVQTFESGTQVNRTTASLFHRQGESVYAAGKSVDLDLMPSLPIKTQVAVRKMQLNNEGSTT